MRISDSSGQEAVTSQVADRRSISVPGFRSTRSNLGVPVPISLSFRSNALYAGPRQPHHWHNLKRRHIILPEAGPGSIEHEEYRNQQRPDPYACLPSLPSASARRIGVPCTLRDMDGRSRRGGRGVGSAGRLVVVR